ncbi:hypothetical protein [Iodidimonas sp. SYSU 1G8]|uniref:hypothetical protein n=1 Tax=Iodidimonas sp. SYSU 1G8 TaxID=3133967 RepID=UPI0031FE94F5
MGQFLICPDSMGAYADALDARLAGHGFRAGFTASVDGFRVMLHRRLNGSACNAVTLENGDFAAHTGSFFFDGEIGAAALRGVHAAFTEKTMPWDRCRGHYALILRKDGALYLVTDRLGSYHVYHRRDEAVFSSSFMAVLDSIDAPVPDPTGIFQYVWNGSTFGDRTVFDAVRLLPAPAVVRFGETVRIGVAGPAIDLFEETRAATVAAHARERSDALRSLFATYGALAPRPVRSALSGGYDSRLILAALRDAGITPELFVFGGEADPDVTTAKRIAAGEGLALRHLDKGRAAPSAPDAFPAQVERDLVAFDGLKYDGLFDSGADYRDRMDRQAGDAVVLNGSAGEIYRNFFYLPDKPLALDDLISAFFSRYDPAAMTSAFSEDAYRDTLAADMMAALRTDKVKVSRPMIEALYPLFRGRYWSARDVSVNQRFGWMLYPFLEPEIIAGTNTIPYGVKQFGRLEAAMIRHLSPELARYRTAYGMSLEGEPPLSFKLKQLASIHRPAAIRRRTYRFARHAPPPPWLTRPWLGTVLDMELPYMRALFRTGRMKAPEALNRMLTIEYLCQRANAPYLPVNS